jgi:hypothetical protein
VLCDLGRAASTFLPAYDPLKLGDVGGFHHVMIEAGLFHALGVFWPTKARQRTGGP